MRLLVILICMFLAMVPCSGVALYEIYEPVPTYEDYDNIRVLLSILTGSDFHRDYFSGEYADERTRGMVQEIMYDMGFADSAHVHVMYLNEKGFKEWGDQNLIATSNTIFIDRKWFESVSLEEQHFLLAHELAHIYTQDGRTLALFAAAACMVIGYKFYEFVRDQESAAGYFGLVTALGFVLPAYGRYQEQRADINGAKALGTTDGGIKCCKRWLATRPSLEPLSWLHQFYKDMFATHPSAQRRIEALEALCIT